MQQNKRSPKEVAFFSDAVSVTSPELSSAPSSPAGHEKTGPSFPTRPVLRVAGQCRQGSRQLPDAAEAGADAPSAAGAAGSSNLPPAELAM